MNKNMLEIGGVSVEQLAKSCQTPLYIYDEEKSVQVGAIPRSISERCFGNRGTLCLQGIYLQSLIGIGKAAWLILRCGKRWRTVCCQTSRLSDGARIFPWK